MYRNLLPPPSVRSEWSWDVSSFIWKQWRDQVEQNKSGQSEPRLRDKRWSSNVADWKWETVKALFRAIATVSMSYVDINSSVFKRTSFHFFRV
jgi:hypothetical protein